MEEATARRAARAGVRAAAPLVIAVFPFGLVYGVAVGASSVDPWVGGAASWLILAGAAQLSMLDLIDGDAAWIVVVSTGLVINARFALYSAALAPAFARFPRRWRFTLPYLLTDQAAAISLQYYEHQRDPVARRWFFLAGASSFAASWWVSSVIGVLAGGGIPEALQISFAVPVMFLALLVPTLRDRTTLAAATVGAGVAILGAPLPNGINILIGALAGIAAGRVSDR
ncbi:MAG: AzlC family ABC transporter permease [Acidimicrobiia bacterium]|nr:AzlC family ABC transporter permease [Acidimicrobiia bacterium]